MQPNLLIRWEDLQQGFALVAEILNPDTPLERQMELKAQYLQQCLDQNGDRS